MDGQRERLLTHLRRCVGKAKINDDTKIYHDLGIGGDDAFEFLDHISTEFKVDFSEMRFSDYFPDETEAFSERIGKFLGFKSKRRPLTVNHLLQILEEGRWREPHKEAEVGSIRSGG